MGSFICFQDKLFHPFPKVIYLNNCLMSIYDGSGSTQYPGNQSGVRKAFSPCARGAPAPGWSSVWHRQLFQHHPPVLFSWICPSLCPNCHSGQALKQGMVDCAWRESWKASLRRWHVRSLLNGRVAVSQQNVRWTVLLPVSGTWSHFSGCWSVLGKIKYNRIMYSKGKDVLFCWTFLSASHTYTCTCF